jgi:predicted nucleotide-binding protein
VQALDDVDGSVELADGTPTVFVVHGHDERVRAVVARFLEQLGLNVVILHEKPNAGRTIIEKFVQEASPVSYAVAVFTPDDVGSVLGGELRPRARQNVVLELGYFLGKLGRGRVAAIVDGSIETPGDYDGVLFTPFEGDSWKLKLAQDMKHAGLPIDMNKAIE